MTGSIIPLHSPPVQLALPVVLVVMGFSLAGCPQPVPKVAIPGFDASPPTLVWQTYNMQTKERGEIAKDGQSLGYSPASNTSSRSLRKISTAG